LDTFIHAWCAKFSIHWHLSISALVGAGHWLKRDLVGRNAWRGDWKYLT
jgi:hypothetical protein